MNSKKLTAQCAVLQGSYWVAVCAINGFATVFLLHIGLKSSQIGVVLALGNILGNVSVKEKGYYITESCIGCGTCMKHCPQKCIEKGTPFVIRQEHCLHCGNCYENCPVKAVIRK